jgi:hypothetical protein
MKDSICHRCGNVVPPIEVHYSSFLGVSFCKDCAQLWLQMRERQAREEREFLQALGKGVR